MESQKESLFKNLFDENGPKLVLFANKYVLDLAIAKDMVQESFLALWERIDNFTHQKAILSFLYISTKNNCLNYLKKKEKIQFGISEDLSGDDFFYQNYLKVEYAQIIHHYISCLPQKQKEALILHYFKGYSHQEIAEHLDISINTVHTHLKRARLFLKKKLIGMTLKSLLLLVFIQQLLILFLKR
jgi:RNA polymerase sigma-70 factor (ECF subfamily)